MAPSGEKAAIGSSISVVGDLTGDEDLTILGRVEGKVNLAQHHVTIGSTGRVVADIYAKTISVEGEVRGNLYATEQILIRKAGSVQGNLTSPRVMLEDGCKFKGAIDMESSPEKIRNAPSVAKPQPALAPPSLVPPRV